MTPRRHGYGLVLALVAVSTVFQLSVSEADGPRFLVIALQAATLVAAVRTAEAAHAAVRAAAAVAVVIVVTSLVTWIVRGEIPEAPAAIVNGLLVGVAPVVLAASLIRNLRTGREVRLPILAGVLAIYLLFGMFFSFTYGAVQAIDPGALFAGMDAVTRAEELYFSFVTLCTVGYGDFVPGSEGTRAIAVAEMLVGQIYLVTIVSLIVANLGRPRTA